MSVIEGLCAGATRALRLLPPEAAHRVALELLKVTPGSWYQKPHNYGVDLSTNVEGLGKLYHPIGLAAGFDKDADAAGIIGRLGFSFVEFGTVTPRPQSGNPKPRIFRFPESRALINRMGFNSSGVQVVAQNLRGHSSLGFPIGVNVGKNRTTAPDDALADYVMATGSIASMADYVTINLSSPNTPGLRDLANPKFVTDLVEQLRGEAGLSLDKLWFKLDPDMAKRDFCAVVDRIAELDCAGVIVSNTHRVELPESGGLSGHPLSARSTRCLEWVWEVAKGRLAVIGVGGVLCGVDIYEKLIRGASAVQIYTALIYRGPFVVRQLLRELAAEIKSQGFDGVRECIGTYYS